MGHRLTSRHIGRGLRLSKSESTPTTAPMHSGEAPPQLAVLVTQSAATIQLTASTQQEGALTQLAVPMTQSAATIHLTASPQQKGVLTQLAVPIQRMGEIPQLVALVRRGGAVLSRGGEGWGSRSRLPVFLLKWSGRTRSEKTHEREAGFTLIEMMVVMAIIGLMAAMAVPSITSYFQVSLGSAAREMAGTVKETYNATVITGQVHRLVYDLKENSYWVESGPANVLLDTKESREREERKKRFAVDSDKKKDESPFQMDKTVTRKKISLPSGVTFEDVKTQQSEEPITEGKAYTHFFPHGMIEQTIIHLKDQSKHHVSLVLSPIVGKTDMYERYLTEKEAFSAGK